MDLAASPRDPTGLTGGIHRGRDEPNGGRETGRCVSRGRQLVPDGRSVLDDDAVPLLSAPVCPEDKRAIAVDHRHVPLGEVEAVHRVPICVRRSILLCGYLWRHWNSTSAITAVIRGVMR